MSILITTLDNVRGRYIFYRVGIFNRTGRDSLYKSKAKRYIEWGDDNLLKLPQKEVAYQNAIKNLEKRKEQAKLEQIRREREIQQRKNEQNQRLMLAILGGFAKALSSGSSSSNKSYKSNTSKSSYNTGSSNSNKNEKYRQEWLQRKANAEKQLQYYQEKLKKDPNNAALKHNIRTQQEIIQNCNNML